MLLADLARLSRRIDSADPDGCWRWGGYHNEDGYARTKIRTRPDSTARDWKTVLLHRALYEEVVGAIAVGMEIDHLCRHRWCVNPSHLEPVTHTENVLRGDGWGGVNARKTHCKRGHEFVDGSFYRMRRGGRRCQACRRWRHANGGVS